jgi:hypothetical protein
VLIAIASWASPVSAQDDRTPEGRPLSVTPNARAPIVMLTEIPAEIPLDVLSGDKSATVSGTSTQKPVRWDGFGNLGVDPFKKTSSDNDTKAAATPLEGFGNLSVDPFRKATSKPLVSKETPNLLDLFGRSRGEVWKTEGVDSDGSIQRIEYSPSAFEAAAARALLLSDFSKLRWTTPIKSSARAERSKLTEWKSNLDADTQRISGQLANARWQLAKSERYLDQLWRDHNAADAKFWGYKAEADRYASPVIVTEPRELMETSSHTHIWYPPVPRWVEAGSAAAKRQADVSASKIPKAMDVKFQWQDEVTRLEDTLNHTQKAAAGMAASLDSLARTTEKH